MASMQTNGGAMRRRLVGPLAAALLAACGGGGGSGSERGGAGLATDMLRQQPPTADCSLITHLQVPVTAASFGTATGQQVRVFDAPRTIDLMAPQSGVLQSLGLPPLGAGVPPRVRLSTAEGTVAFSTGATAVLKVPGGARVSASGQVPAGAFADLAVPAVDACAAVHAAGNSGQWLLTGDVTAQLRTLPFSDTPQLVAGRFVPLPGGFASVQPNGSGGFLVQRYDSFGNASGQPLTIMLPLGTGDTSPALTPLASGYLATWLGPALDPQVPLGNHYPLFAQLLDASGQPLGAPVQVAITTPFTSRIVPASLPHAAALPDGGAALVWVEQRTGSLDVFLQRFSASGLMGDPLQVNVTAAQGGPTVVGQNNGGVLVVWGTGSLFARVVAPDGTAGPEQAIAPDAASLSGIASVSPAPGGGAAVAWESQSPAGVVFVEHLGPDGAPLSGPQPVTGVGGPPQSGPSVGVLADGSAVVAWVESGNSPVLARRFAPGGAPLGAAQEIVGSHATAPVVVPLPWGGFLIEVATSGGVIARMFDAQALEN